MIVNAQIEVLIEQLAERVVRKFILDFSQFGSKLHSSGNGFNALQHTIASHHLAQIKRQIRETMSVDITTV